MVPYFITFGLSSLLCAFGERYAHKNRRKKAEVFFFLSVLIAAILAGVRDLSIGTDIWTYGEYSFRAARSNANFFSYVSSHSELDLLYNVLVWIIARFTSNSHWLYFFAGLITYYFIMKGIRQYEQQMSITIAWIVFLFLYYGDTLNIIRQWISVSIAFWGIKFAINRNYMKYLITTIIAILFHNTAIISFFIFIMISFIKEKDSLMRKAIIIIFVSTATVLYGEILNIFINLGILGEKYSRYFTSGFALSLNPIIIRMPFLIIIFIWYKAYSNAERNKIKKWELSTESDIVIMLLIIDPLISAARGTMTTLYRVAYMFGIYRTIAYSRIYCVMRRNNRYIILLILLLYLTLLWIYQNVFQGNNEIYPYKSEILGIY